MRIKTLAQLAKAAQESKAVTVTGWGGFQRSPASFIMCMQAGIVHRMISAGMHVYKPKKKKPTKLRWIKPVTLQRIEQWESDPVLAAKEVLDVKLNKPQSARLRKFWEADKRRPCPF
jgi:hypothetical protein